MEECPKKRDAIVEKVNAIRGKSRSRELRIDRDKLKQIYDAVFGDSDDFDCLSQLFNSSGRTVCANCYCKINTVQLARMNLGPNLHMDTPHRSPVSQRANTERQTTNHIRVTLPILITS